MTTNNKDEKYCTDIIESIYMAVNYLPNHKISKQIQWENPDNKLSPWINFNTSCANYLEKTKANMQDRGITLSHDKFLHGTTNYVVHYESQTKNVKLHVDNYIIRALCKVQEHNPMSSIELFYQNWFN